MAASQSGAIVGLFWIMKPSRDFMFPPSATTWRTPRRWAPTKVHGTPESRNGLLKIDSIPSSAQLRVIDLSTKASNLLWRDRHLSDLPVGNEYFGSLMFLSGYCERSMTVQRASIASLRMLSVAQKCSSASSAKMDWGGHSGKSMLSYFC